MKFPIVKGTTSPQPYFWRIVASNGETLAVSEHHAQKASAQSAVASVMKHAAGATVEDLS